MAMPLDNTERVTLRAAAEANLGRAEPVFEFGRKKSSIYAGDPLEDRASLNIHGGVQEREASWLHTFSFPQISLPRDNAKPLVTSSDRYAKESLDAYKGLRTRLLKSQVNQGFRSIAVTSVSRGEGKTVTAFNLACCCAQVENLSVLLIDGDLRNRSLTKLMRGLPEVGLADVIGSEASCEQAIAKTDLPNLYVMGAGVGVTQSTELFSTVKWSEVIRWSRQHFRIVLVDTLAMNASADFELIEPECDGVLMVVRARNTSKDALKAAVGQLDAGKLVGIVWNGFNS